MAYGLNFSRNSRKELEKISEPHYSRIKQAIYNLTQNPRPNGYIKLVDRVGYRIRVGNYRIYIRHHR
jgi:mRNA interferase RelE/StbE